MIGIINFATGNQDLNTNCAKSADYSDQECCPFRVNCMTMKDIEGDCPLGRLNEDICLV